MRMTRPPGRIVGGRVFLGDKDLLTLDDNALRKIRLRDIAFVPQGAMNSLNPVMRIEDQMIDAILAHETTGRSKKELDARVVKQLAKVGLPPTVARRYPHELSGGMKQRVLIALSLLLEPQLIILDEPTTALDILTQRAIIDLLGTLRKKLGFSMIFISHDLSIAAELADRMITMYAGTVVERASVTDLFYRPRHPYSVGLLRAVPRVSGAMGAVESIPGSPPDLIRLPPGCTYIPRCPLAIAACADREPDLVAVDTPDHEARCIRWKTVAEQVGTAEVAVAEKIATA